MHYSLERNGQTCWYLTPGVGLIAINDACLLESCIYILLKKYFRQHPAYVDMIESFREISLRWQAATGRELLVQEEQRDLGNDLQTTQGQVTTLTTEIAFLWMQDSVSSDSLLSAGLARDADGHTAADPGCTDFFVYRPRHASISKETCSRIVIQALCRASAEQREALLANYGRRNKHSEQEVLAILEDVGLKQDYLEGGSESAGEAEKSHWQQIAT